MDHTAKERASNLLERLEDDVDALKAITERMESYLATNELQVSAVQTKLEELRSLLQLNSPEAVEPSSSTSDRQITSNGNAEDIKPDIKPNIKRRNLDKDSNEPGARKTRTSAATGNTSQQSSERPSLRLVNYIIPEEVERVIERTEGILNPGEFCKFLDAVREVPNPAVVAAGAFNTDANLVFCQVLEVISNIRKEYYHRKLPSITLEFLDRLDEIIDKFNEQGDGTTNT